MHMKAHRAVRSAVFAAVAGLSCGLVAPVQAADPRHPSPIQITDDGATVWVANPDSDSVGKITTATNSLTGEYPVGHQFAMAGNRRSWRRTKRGPATPKAGT